MEINHTRGGGKALDWKGIKYVGKTIYTTLFPHPIRSLWIGGSGRKSRCYISAKNIQYKENPPRVTVQIAERRRYKLYTKQAMK